MTFQFNDMKSIVFVETSWRCPEQYDVYYETQSERKLIGYVRLRWGELTCSFPDANGVCVYYHNFDDAYKGGFDDDGQRNFYLRFIAEVLLRKVESNYESEKEKLLPEIKVKPCRTFANCDICFAVNRESWMKESDTKIVDHVYAVKICSHEHHFCRECLEKVVFNLKAGLENIDERKE